jgi:hypothetical protein
MSYLPHCKVILSGVLGTSALAASEIWTTGHQISDTNFADLPSQAQVDAIAAAWRSNFITSPMNIAGSCYLTGCKVVAIDADGKWRKNPDGSFMARTGALVAAAGFATSFTTDYAIASVSSLMTPRAGAHGRGRMYWPLPAEPADATGHTTNTAANNRAQAVRSAFLGVNTALATGTYQGVAVVASQAGFLSPITAVRVGNVHDTQRRRRNALVETYSVQVL